MKSISDSINEALDIERVSVTCVNELPTKYHKFNKGEELIATRINSNWWIIDSIGISEKDFKKCFKKINK